MSSPRTRGPITTGISGCAQRLPPRRDGSRCSPTMAGARLSPENPALFLAEFFLCCAIKMPVGAVEHGVGRRGPFGAGRQRLPAVIDAARLQFALGGFLLAHLLEFE